MQCNSGTVRDGWMSDGTMHGGGVRRNQQGTLGTYSAKQLLKRKRKQVH